MMCWQRTTKWSCVINRSPTKSEKWKQTGGRGTQVQRSGRHGERSGSRSGSGGQQPSQHRDHGRESVGTGGEIFGPFDGNVEEIPGGRGEGRQVRTACFGIGDHVGRAGSETGRREGFLSTSEVRSRSFVGRNPGVGRMNFLW